MNRHVRSFRGFLELALRGARTAPSRGGGGAWRVAAAWVLACAVAPAAHANMAAMRPALAGGPAVLGPTRLEVTGERLRIDCGEEGGAPRCTFEARYAVRNPGSAPETVVVAFYGAAAKDISPKGPGVGARGPLTPVEQAALDVAAGLSMENPANSRHVRPRFHAAHELTRTPFTLTVAAGASVECVVSGTFELRGRWRGHYMVLPGRYARHLALSTVGEARHFELAYLLSPLRSWASAGPIELEVRYPSRWQVSGLLSTEPQLQSGTSRDAALQGQAEGGLTVARATLRAAESASLTLRAALPAPSFALGGPVIGLGAALRDASFRARLGYEVSAPGWLLHSLNVDTDFRSLVVLAPMVEAVTPQVILLPWLSLGVGMPIRVRPSTDVGVRLQFGVGFLSVGFVASIDYFPGLPGEHPDHLRTTLYAHISF